MSDVKSARTELTNCQFDAATFYSSQLKKSAVAVDYLRARGVSGAIAARYYIGWAPPGWQSLKQCFSDYERNAGLLETGLTIESEKEGANRRRYDRFRERVMLPVLSADGAFLGFGGRVIRDDAPKYMNSPASTIFNKGELLFGLYQARASISQLDQIVVVEGYMDVMALAQFERQNTVATLGTAMTLANAANVSGLANDVRLCFDGDAAGQQAAFKAALTMLEVVDDARRVRIVTLPTQHDPDSFVREGGPSAWDELMGQSINLLDYVVAAVERMHSGTYAEARATRAHVFSQIAARVRHDSVLHELISRASENSGVSAACIAEKSSVEKRAASHNSGWRRSA